MPLSERLIRSGLWALLAALLAVEGLYLYSHTVFPYLLVISEDGMYMSARAFQAGWDPWATDKIVAYSNNYGWLYPWAAAKATALLPGLPLLLLMRLLSALSALGALAALGWALLRAGLEGLPVAAFFVAALACLLFHDSISIRPDSFALLFYLGSLVLASGRKTWSPYAAGAIAALGYFAKPYAILALPLGALLCLAQGRRREALVLSASGALAGALLLALTLWLHPNYLFGTLGALASDERYEFGHLLRQNGEILSTHAALLLGGLALWAWRSRQKMDRKPKGEARAWAWAALAAWTVMLFGLGGHLGAFLRYYQQLFLPLALLAFALWCQQLRLAPLGLAALLSLDAACMLAYDLAAYPLRPLSQEAQADWKKAEGLVKAYPGGYFDPLLANLADAQGPLALPTEHSRHLIRLGVRSDSIREIRARVFAKYRTMEKGEIPLLVTAYEAQFEDYGYRIVDRLDLETPLTPPGEKAYKMVYYHAPVAAKNLSK